MRPACRDETGFTLLEILIALLILGLLMAGLAQAVQFGVHAWNNQAGTVVRNGDLDTTDRTLRTLLTRMQPPAEPDQPSLQGAAEQMVFSSELPEGATGGLTRMAVLTLVVDGSQRLVLRWSMAPHAKLLGPPLAPHTEVLLTGIDRLELSYRNVAGTWRPTWTTPTLPQLVRMHMVFAGQNGRHWPDIVVAPMRDSISETGE